MHRSIPVTEPSRISAVRTNARVMALGVGFDETEAHRAGIVATELATNLVKHVRNESGEMLLHASGEAGDGVLELIALDRGQGMRNLEAAQVDGYSTSGTPGTGLGAIRRLSDAFDIYTQPDRGTTVLARVHARRGLRSLASQRFVIGAVSVAKPGESVCGDGWSVQSSDAGASVLVVDGLGHGPFAAEAAVAAAVTFRSRIGDTPGAVLERMHDGLRHTRGAAAAVAGIGRNSVVLTYAGVGNIAGVISDRDQLRHLVSQNGTLGHQARHFREYSYPWPPGALLIMHSDGLATHWSFAPYPGLSQRDPSLIAATLYRDHGRRRDDVTVVVGRGAEA